MMLVDMVLDVPAMDMALDTTDMALDTMARGLLMLRLIPTTMVDTMVDMVLDMLAMDMALDTMDMALDTMARGLLMLRLIPTTMVDTMVDMVLDMPAMDMALDTTDMALDTTARGLLMLRLIPTTMVDTMVDMAVDTMADTDMVLATMAMDVVFMATTDKSTNPYLFPDLLQPRDLIKYQDLSVNQVLSPCHQNGLYHSSSPPPVLPVSVLCQSSLTRNGQQEAENQNVMIFLK